MLLQLDERYRISVDSSRQNFQLEKLENIKDKQTKEVVRQDYKIIGYHGNNFGSVLKLYAKESLIDIDSLETLNLVLDKLDEINRTIDRVVRRENIILDVKQDD